MKKNYYILIAVVTLLVFIFMFLYKNADFDSLEIAGSGANGNAYEYGRNLKNREYNSFEEVVEAEKLAYDKDKILLQLSKGNLEIVFVMDEESLNVFGQDEKITTVRSIETVVNENGKYIYSGGRILKIDYLKYSRKDSENCNWEDTVRADLSMSTMKEYKDYVAEGVYDILPAWGITDNENVYQMSIDGQKVDEVIEIDTTGNKFYFWIIYDLQTSRNIKEIDISINDKQQE